MNTTISISKSVRDEIREFGMKGDSYDEILKKLIRSAKERQLQELLMDEKDTIPIDTAITEAKKRWQK